jgi:hypothetical protein
MPLAPIAAILRARADVFLRLVGLSAEIRLCLPNVEQSESRSDVELSGRRARP